MKEVMEMIKTIINVLMSGNVTATTMGDVRPFYDQYPSQIKS
jgi:hypothetical protein